MYGVHMENSFVTGQKIETKKQHPCGSKVWEIIRTGADFKIKCTGCGRVVMLSYEDFRKRVKKVLD